MASHPSLVQGLAQHLAARGSLDAWQGHKVRLLCVEIYTFSPVMHTVRNTATDLRKLLQALLGLARDVAFPPDTIIASTSQPTGSRSSATPGTHAPLLISSRLLPTRHSLLFPVTSGSLLAGEHRRVFQPGTVCHSDDNACGTRISHVHS